MLPRMVSLASRGQHSLALPVCKGTVAALHTCCGTNEGNQGLLICLVFAVLAPACSFASWTDPGPTDKVRHAVLEHFSLLYSQGIALEQCVLAC